MPPHQNGIPIEQLGELLGGASSPLVDPNDQFSSSLEFEPGAQVEAPDVFELGDNGEMVPVYPEDDLMSPVAQSPQFYQNIAEHLDDDILGEISSELLDRIEDDIRSREPWETRYRRGMEMMGVISDEMDDGPFPGASTAVMPVISEAVVQFWARSLGEQIPSEGPVKASVKGILDKAVLARGDRVADYMNHEMLQVDRSWYTEHSRMLFALPQHGSCFKKVMREHDTGSNASIFVEAEDFIANFKFNDLDTAPRYTHRIWKTGNELRKAQVRGVYLDVDLSPNSGAHEDLPEATRLRHEAIDIEPETQDLRDSRYEIFECHCEWDIPGFEDVDEYGRPTGIALPYIVTIDKESEQVLSIYRSWKEHDPLKRRRVTFVKYDYLPSTGFYGFGLFHMIGGLQEAATGALRLIIDGSATASLQGGFISKDASMRGQDLTLEPGVWKHVDAGYEDLSKAFFNPPLREPSPVLFNILGLLTERAEKFAATTEMMTGDTNAKNAPVGSTLALLEQGGKVFSAIHRGLHRSLGEELRMRHELLQEYLPLEGYPWPVEGDNVPNLMQEDFAPGYQIVPVSDPNIFSSEQRSALNQAVYQLAQENPDIIKRDVAVRRILEGMRAPDIDELLIQHEPPPPMDPISEVQAILRGEPVQAYPEQDHLAHLEHYAAFLNNPQFGANPQIAEQIAGAGMALVGQRLAYAWATHARGLGAPAGYLPPPMGGGEEQANPGAPGMGQLPMQPDQQLAMQQQQQLPMQPNAPPEQLAKMAAQIAPQMAKVPGMPDPAAEAASQADQAKAQESQAKAQATLMGAQTKQQTAESQIQLKAMETQNKIQLEQIKEAGRQAIAEITAQAKIAIEQSKASQKEKESKRKQATDTLSSYAKSRADEAQLQAKLSKAEQDMATDAAQVDLEAAIATAKAEQDMQLKAEESKTRQETAKKAAKAQAAKPKKDKG